MLLLDKSFYKKEKLFSFLPISFGLISGIAVFYFLYFFEAYGIQKGVSYSGHSHLFRSISFGVLTFTYLFFLESYVKSRFQVITLSKQFYWYLSLIVIGNQLIFLLFNFFWNWQEWNIEAYLLIQKEFPLMMFFPLSFYLMIQAFSKEKETKLSTYLFLKSDNNKDHLKVKMEDFLCAMSSGNYITITYKSNGIVKEHLIRKTLKKLEDELKDYPTIKRSHRSYLVNTSNIQLVKQIKGKFYLEILELIVPISKQYQKTFI
ncbi:LytTR family DNA-binding domain-containing protein [uncultured Tenacibaculum sp.]|uniref:LytR/AlgR family response regulator transcription factor n=1 Tax=uncultured Tenacibaculum sp. TaxID=174713 RepID=UPI0026069ABB|nr:LytTR family transcriptional regulator DNA-binding domain-containing protein [uncultured Tenacibaculum sp.]